MAEGLLVFSLQPYHSDFNPKILLILLAKLQQPGGRGRHGGCSIGLYFPWILKPIKLSVSIGRQEV